MRTGLLRRRPRNMADVALAITNKRQRRSRNRRPVTSLAAPYVDEESCTATYERVAPPLAKAASKASAVRPRTVARDRCTIRVSDAIAIALRQHHTRHTQRSKPFGGRQAAAHPAGLRTSRPVHAFPDRRIATSSP